MLTATDTDPWGNVSTPTPPFSFNLLTSAPSSPVLTSISPDTGSSGTDFATDATNLKFSGTADVGSTVQVYLNNNPGPGSGPGSLAGTAVADKTGNWTFDNTAVSLSQGTYALSLTATNVVGTVGKASQPVNVSVITAAPAAPVLTVVSPGTTVSGVTWTNRRSR